MQAMNVITSLAGPRRGISQVLPIKPALCLDLDGTIRHSKSGEFINGPLDVALFPDVEAKLWEYRKKGYLIFGISNQGGVAYGFKSFLTNDQEIEATINLFKENPFHIVKCCFHHPKGSIEPWNHRSLLRKPDIGMLVLCEVEAFDLGYVIDWDNSLFVGDRLEDEQCAERAGLRFISANEFFGR
jgi:D-glycero-D-manno-heptose 1,7-bisphosphate phosphatase